jgi:hypothetical protein
MLPGRRGTNQQRTLEEVESVTSGFDTTHHAMQNIRREVRMEQERLQERPVEVTVYQALGMVAEILQLLTERRTPRVEEAILGWFHELQPPTFSGNEESGEQAGLWIAQMEGIFQTLPYVDQQKVEFAVHHLRGPAWNWWLRIQANRTQREMTWEHFVVVFRAEYVSQRIEIQDENFLKLQQMTRLMHRYAARLKQSFERYRQLMDTEKSIAQQMVRELRQELLQVTAPPPSAAISETMSMTNQTGNRNQDRPDQQFSRTIELAPRRENFKRPRRRQLRKCYNCGEPGHLSYNCPKPIGTRYRYPAPSTENAGELPQ